MEIYNIVLAVIFAIIFYGIFLGAGQNRKMVVFMNYDDLGLTFAVPASPHWCSHRWSRCNDPALQARRRHLLC